MTVELGLKLVSDYMSHLSSRHMTGALYRGHASRSWVLLPSAFRPNSFGIRTLQDLQRWKDAASRFVDRPASNLEWLVLAQHYGVATALLDWTSNPLIALYFACQSYTDPAHNAHEGAVLTMTREGLRTERNPGKIDIFEKWHGPPLLVPSTTMNRRSLAQDSVMTLHCEGNQGLTSGYDPTIYIVDAPSKRSVLEALRLVGVSSDRVYADINTVAREFIDERFQEGLARVFARTQDVVGDAPPRPPRAG